MPIQGGGGGGSGSGGGAALLATGTVSGGVITVASISQSYHTLLIYVLARATAAVGPYQLGFQFNGDTTNGHYSWVFAGTTASHAVDNAGLACFIPDSTATAGTFGVAKIEIPFYSQSAVNITASGQGGESLNNFEAHVSSTTWLPTSLAAITQVVINTRDGTALAAGCQALVYGL